MRLLKQAQGAEAKFARLREEVVGLSSPGGAGEWANSPATEASQAGRRRGYARRRASQRRHRETAVESVGEVGGSAAAQCWEGWGSDGPKSDGPLDQRLRRPTRSNFLESRSLHVFGRVRRQIGSSTLALGNRQ